MANPTTNYGFVLPTPTDLVTDLPADFDVALQGVDTQLKALQPGTTAGDLAYSSATANTNVRLGIGTAGQVLAVVAGVPAWTTGTTGDIEGVTAGTGISGGGTSGTVTVTNTMATAIDAKGDLIVGTGADAFSRLAVGATNNMVLTVDSAQATGLKYALPAGGGKVLQVVAGTTSTAVSNSTTTYADSGLTATITPTLASSKILIMITQPTLVANFANSQTQYSGQYKLFRGSTAISGDASNDQLIRFIGASSNDPSANLTHSYSFLDSPSTTSATTYKTQLKGLSNFIRAQFDSNTSSIILLEIGA